MINQITDPNNEVPATEAEARGDAQPLPNAGAGSPAPEGVFTPSVLDKLREIAGIGTVAVKGHLLIQLLDDLEYWEKDSAAAWDKCEERRLSEERLSAERNKLKAALTEIAETRIPGGGLSVDAYLVRIAMAALA